MQNQLRILTVILAGISLGGCVSVKAPKEIKIGSETYYDREGKRHYDDRGYDDDDRHERKRVDKDEAYDIARKVARYENVEPGEYEIHDKEIDHTYWVLFEHKRPAHRRRWRNHFAVRVGPYGKARLYAKAFREFPSEWDERKVSKDDAYRIANRIARRADVDLRDYKIHDKEIHDTYWVLYEIRNPRRKLGWRNFFTIRVSPFGTATFYRGDQ